MTAMKSILLPLLIAAVTARVCYRGVTNSSEPITTMSSSHCDERQACLRYRKPNDVYIMDCDSAGLCLEQQHDSCSTNVTGYELVCCCFGQLCNDRNEF